MCTQLCSMKFKVFNSATTEDPPSFTKDWIAGKHNSQYESGLIFSKKTGQNNHVNDYFKFI